VNYSIPIYLKETRSTSYQPNSITASQERYCRAWSRLQDFLSRPRTVGARSYSRRGTSRNHFETSQLGAQKTRSEARSSGGTRITSQILRKPCSPAKAESWSGKDRMLADTLAENPPLTLTHDKAWRSDLVAHQKLGRQRDCNATSSRYVLGPGHFICVQDFVFRQVARWRSTSFILVSSPPQLALVCKRGAIHDHSPSA
jgi:hypothetical protein